jgi:2-polyprenyl-6-methoxyphenol hydroxylase-like FAD-dependent oxidoreductase
MTAPATAPVVIVGGGPVGLTTALELASHGIASTVLEPRVTLDHTRPRAKTVSVRSMEHFRRLHLADTIRERAPIPVAWSQRAAVRTAVNGVELASFEGVFGLVAERDDLFAETAQQITQPLLEQILRETAEASPLITLVVGATATAVEEQDDTVTVAFTDPTGARSSIRAEYVVGADGASSLTRQATGIQLDRGVSLPPNLSITFRSAALDELIDGPASLHYWIVRQGTQGVLIRLDTQGTWWGTVMGVRDPEHADSGEIIARLVGEPVNAVVLARDVWAARIAVADSYGTKRVFLVGDAAHLNPPWGGHGFNTGLGDAVNLGWKIAAVLQGWGGAELLASYEKERLPIARQTVGVAAANMRAIPPWLTEAFASNPTLRGTHGAALSEEVRRAKFSEFNSLGLVLGAGYADSPVIHSVDDAAPRFDPERYDPSARPGTRLPHRWLDDDRSLFDEVSGNGFTLLGDPASELARSFVAAAADRAVPLAVFDPESADGPVLVRSDGHIAWAGQGDGIDPGAVLDRARGALS